MAIGTTLSNPAYRFGSSSIFLTFVAWAIWWSFYQLWMTSDAGGLDLTGGEVGTVFAIHGIVSAIAMLAYGAIQDKLDLRRNLTIFIALLMSLTGPFVTWVYKPALETNLLLGATIGGLFLATAFTGSVGLLEAYVDRLSRRTAFEYGQARMWGSFGYAVGALAAGIIFTINPILIFWMGSVFGLVLLATQLWWRLEVPRDEQVPEGSSAPSLKQILGISRDPKFWALVVFVFLSWNVYSIVEAQVYPSFYASLYETEAAGQRAYGFLASAQTLLETICMGLIPVVVTKIGVRTSLVASAAMMTVPFLGGALLNNIALISITKLSHAIIVPLMIVAIMRYIAMHFDARLSATVFLVGFYVTTNGASAIISNPIGRMRDALGYETTLIILAATVASAVFAALIALRRDDDQIARTAA